MLFEEHPANKLSNDCSENVIIAFQSLSFHYIQILKIFFRSYFQYIYE